MITLGFELNPWILRSFYQFLWQTLACNALTKRRGESLYIYMNIIQYHSNILGNSIPQTWLQVWKTFKVPCWTSMHSARCTMVFWCGCCFACLKGSSLMWQVPCQLFLRVYSHGILSNPKVSQNCADNELSKGRRNLSWSALEKIIILSWVQNLPSLTNDHHAMPLQEVGAFKPHFVGCLAAKDRQAQPQVMRFISDVGVCHCDKLRVTTEDAS